MSTILAVDPGTHRAAAVWLNPDGTLAGWERIALADGYLSDRLTALRAALDRVAELAEPGVLVTELLRGHGVRPAPELDAAVGELRRWARERRIKCVVYRPQQWRTGLLGRPYGSSDKELVAMMLRWRYPALAAIPDDGQHGDVIDAAGLGLHHYEVTRTPLAQALAEGELSPARRTIHRK